jgi:hypothetical protein
VVELLAILALGVVCAVWVLVQRQADRVLPGNPGVDRDCGGCPLPAEGEPPATAGCGRREGSGCR